MKRYKELKFEDKTITETHLIDQELIKHKFEWFLDCEVENVCLEIKKNTLVFNSGVFFNGTWQYGVWQDGQWIYGTWEGGVWYNGTWRNGIFKNGLIFGGRFLSGKIEGGEIRGGDIFDVQISKEVVNNTVQKVTQKSQPQTGQPQNRGVQQKVHGQTQPVVEVPQGVQPQKIEERIKKYNTFINEKLINNDMKKLKKWMLDYGYKIIEEEENSVVIDEDYWGITQNEDGTYRIENPDTIYNHKATYDEVIDFLENNL